MKPRVDVKKLKRKLWKDINCQLAVQDNLEELHNHIHGKVELNLPSTTNKIKEVKSK